jgi:hypothetical protein
MELTSFQYKQGHGWSIQDWPNLDSENTLVLVFAAPEFIDDPAPLKELVEHYPHSKIIGCSSAGEISGSLVNDKSITVAVARFERTTIKITSVAIDETKDAYLVGEKIAKTLNGKDLKGIFLLSEGLKINGTDLISGLNCHVPENIIVTGGLAGDGDRFKQTWTIVNGDILENSVVAIGLYGDHIKIGHGSRGGWDIFGPERRITRSKNNVLYELDNKPALELYKEYLGERASGLPATGLFFPLAIRKSITDTHKLVRTILAVNEVEQSLTFAGDMPMGNLAQLMRANFDRLITGATEASVAASETLVKLGEAHGPVLAIAVSCVGRRLVLGERIEEETESTLASLPEQTQQIGFYSYGELSPYGDGACDLHNQTMTLTTICEE